MTTYTLGLCLSGGLLAGCSGPMQEGPGDGFGGGHDPVNGLRVEFLPDTTPQVPQNYGTPTSKPVLCEPTQSQAALTKQAVDVVLVVDNSYSMAAEVQALGEGLYAELAEPLEAAGVDYRLILLSDFGHPEGSARGLCIGGELNPDQHCPDDANDATYASVPRINAPRFFHYDADGAAHLGAVGSRNALCQALQWYDAPDGFGLAPLGWRQWLRVDAHKVFVLLSDDRVHCGADLDGDGRDDVVLNDASGDPVQVASAFDSALAELDSRMLFPGGERGYVWHSIVSLPELSGQVAYGSQDSIQGQNCPSGEKPGVGYEALSLLTGGLRIPICSADQAAVSGDGSGFDAALQAIADDVVASRSTSCQLGLPADLVDASTLSMELGGTPLSQGCSDDGVGFELGSAGAVLCASSCSQLRSQPQPALRLLYGCR